MAVQLEGVPHPPVGQVRVKAPVNREVALRPVQRIAAPEIEVARIAAAQAQARWTEVAAVQEGTGSGIVAFLPRPAAGTAARSAAARAVQAGVTLERAAAEDLPVMGVEVPAVLEEEVPAAAAAEAVAVVAAVGDGGK